MKKTLVIVESPAKCKKIEGYLGPGYKCIASYGHIQELNHKLGMKCINVENNFAPSFKEIEDKANNINKLRSEIAKCDEVILATDDDREGEGIAWHICDMFHLPIGNTKRIIFHEITKTAIVNAVKNPSRLNMDIVYAQQARQILDFVVGYEISPILWNNISRNSKVGLSAGRCQSPALRLVYDNQKDIDNSPGKKVYNTTGYFTSMVLGYVLDYNYDNEKDMEKFLEETVNHEHIYTCNKPRNVTKNPPQPYTTSTLQQSASTNINMSPKETMKHAQKLYEGGYITYMRTDSKTLSQDFIETVKPYIKDKYGEEYINKKIDELSVRKEETKKKKSKKKEEENKAQEAHEAIRPTDITREMVEDMEPKAIKLYKLIWKNTVESCMEAAKYSSITSIIKGAEEHNYRYSAEQVIFAGWKIVGGYDKESIEYKFLQTIKNNSIVEYKKIVSKVTMKDLKSHYTEARLVQLLEQKGIGRPSTFSSLIDKIQQREYVKKQDIKGKKIKCIDFELENDEITENSSDREFGNEKGKLVITQTGQIVIEFLIKNFEDIFNYEYTKGMEDNLDIIAKGDKIWYELIQECYEQINTLSKDLKQEKGEKINIKIDDIHTYIIGKNGPVITYKKEDGKLGFKSVKKDINIDDIKNGNLSLEDIEETRTFSGTILGKYEDKDLILKKGKYGLYVTWGENKKSFGWLKCDESEVTYDFIIDKLKNNTSIIREINSNSSIRNGKYGHYIFYKTDKMKKPKFIKLNKFNENYNECDINLLIEYVNNNI